MTATQQTRVVSVWQPERCAGRGGGYCEPGRDPADVAAENCGEDGWVPDLVSCDNPLPGLCWPCLMDLMIVLDDVPLELADLDVGIGAGLDGAEAAHQELVRALEAFAGWLDLEHDEYSDIEVWTLASELKARRVPPGMLRPAVLALAAIDFLRPNVAEPELRVFALDITRASVRARAVIFIPRED